MDRDRDSVAALAFELRETLARGTRRLRIELGPSVSQLAVISHLRRRGPLSTNDLAATERVRPQSMTGTVRSLEESGMVKRRPHPTDRRQVLIELTRKGIRTLDDIYAMREDWLTGVILQKLTAAERQELQQGLRLVRRIIDTP
jgi:DNA-binding MarR family transcriptional regulator